MDCGCASIFNRLSKVDRLKLKGAALTNGITGFLRDDTKIHPVRYPFYAAYLIAVLTPLPVPFVSTALLVSTFLWTKFSQSETAIRMKAHLKEAFNEESLVCQHRKFIKQDLQNPDVFNIKSGALMRHIGQKSWNHGREATKHAWKAFRDFVRQ